MCPARIAASDGAPRYERHQPERTLLYQIIKEYYPQFLAHMERQGRSLPLYVQRKFDDDLECAAWNMAFYLCGAKTPPAGDVRAQVEEVNRQRRQLFAATAKANNLGAVQATASGYYY